MKSKRKTLVQIAQRNRVSRDMNRPNTFTPSPDELRVHASLWWPAELREKEASSSIVPLLIKSQDKFISVLDVSDKSPDSWKDVLKATKDFPANLFLKHLMVLADVGGENLQRLRPELKKIFPDQKMDFVWQGQKHEYKFKAIFSCSRLDNKSLFVDGGSLPRSRDLTDQIEDVIMLLLHGAAVVDAPLPPMIGEKCMIGTLAGKKPEIQKFVGQRYIFASRAGGAAFCKTDLPSLRWVKSSLRNNVGFSVRYRVLGACVVGSFAKGTSNSKSDLDIAVVVPTKPRVSALALSERFHSRMGLTCSPYPVFKDKRVDFQFFYPDDAALQNYSRIELK